MSWVHAFLAVLVTMAPIADPFGSAAVFYSVTEGADDAFRRAQALRACLYQFALLTAFFLFGVLLMRVFSISMSGVRIAGGLLVGRFGVNLISAERQSRTTPEGVAAARQQKDVAFFPMTMPLLAGPGSLSAVISLSAMVPSPLWSHYLAMIVGLACVSVICWGALRYAPYLFNRLGVNGVDALTRIMGFLLLCMGVQFVIDGVGAAFTDVMRALHAAPST